MDAVERAGAPMDEVSEHFGHPGTREDAVDGVIPTEVISPATEGAAAALLAHASAERRSVVIRGGGTRLHWGRTPAHVDVVLSTARLGRILRHEPGDLTVSVEAGATVRDLNRTLAARGQWLPIDTPSDGSTIGGCLATNESGPLRHRYGTARDQLIGIRVATATGRLASAGGNVVKNVAGYDLGRFITGSFGTLAAIVTATFKLSPIPAATETLELDFDDAAAFGSAATALASSQIDAMCLEAAATFGAAEGRRLSLAVRFGGPAAVNAAQRETVLSVARGWPRVRSRVVDGTAEDAVWRAAGTPEARTIVKASWLPARLADIVLILDAIAAATGVRLEMAARAGVGVGTLRIVGGAEASAAAIEQLRSRPEAMHHVVIVRAPADVKTRVDVWGPASAAAPLLETIKAALDPAGILNAGRGPI